MSWPCHITTLTIYFPLCFFSQSRVRAGDIIDDDEEDEYYLQRLDAGLFTLQLIDYIILELSCTSGISSIKQRVLQLLNMRGGSISAIRNTVRGKRILFFFLTKSIFA